MIFPPEKLWSAEKEMIHFFARVPEGGKLRKTPLCKRTKIVENFGAVEKNMRKNGKKCVDFKVFPVFLCCFQQKYTKNSVQNDEFCGILFSRLLQNETKG